MAKVDNCIRVLETRIRRGDYALRELPTESELADEIGTSRMTARRALLHLLDQGILSRKPHGRLGLKKPVEGAGEFRVAFLAPAFASYWIDASRRAVEQAAASVGATVRPVEYVHWDDPVITYTLAGFDGVFIVPSSEAIPPSILERLGKAHHLVVLDDDLSDYGIPSVNMLPTIFIDRLGDHLLSLGHTNIACINTQPHDRIITQRMARWRFWQQ
ncbi:MAG TPA: GntR family transcriptional regulator, partial [Tepidisphaeraceae bacterium]|nr:GntR family transcriptional regulator [Tepidisphaeraceae bacterium]